MKTVGCLDEDVALDGAKREEVLRGQQLLVAAQAFYDGDMSEDEFTGFVVRYGHAATSRRVLRHEINNARKGMN